MPSSFMRSIGSFGSFAGAACVEGAAEAAELGDAAGCCAKVKSGETRKTKSSATVALRLNILTSPLVLDLISRTEIWFDNTERPIPIVVVLFLLCAQRKRSYDLP